MRTVSAMPIGMSTKAKIQVIILESRKIVKAGYLQVIKNVDKERILYIISRAIKILC
jgi:hypothetical protein